MGQTPKNLRCVIWVDDDYQEHAEILALRDKGHVIVPMSELALHVENGSDLPRPHLILSRAAHKWTPEMFTVKGLLEIVMKATRARKKEDKA